MSWGKSPKKIATKQQKSKKSLLFSMQYIHKGYNHHQQNFFYHLIFMQKLRLACS